MKPFTTQQILDSSQEMWGIFNWNFSGMASAPCFSVVADLIVDIEHLLQMNRFF